jgi:hypothetical protein
VWVLIVAEWLQWLAALPISCRQQVDTMLFHLRVVGMTAVVHQLEWYRILWQLREMMRETLPRPSRFSSNQLFLHFLATTYPHRSAQSVQDHLSKLCQLIQLAQRMENAEEGAAKALFERLCASLSPEEKEQLQDEEQCRSDDFPAAASRLRLPNTGLKRDAGTRTMTRKQKRPFSHMISLPQQQLTVTSFYKVGSLIPSIQQWCQQQGRDFERQLRIFLYSPTADIRARIRQQIDARDEDRGGVEEEEEEEEEVRK